MFKNVFSRLARSSSGALALLSLLWCAPLGAETRDYAIELSAAIQKSPAQITLTWRPSVDDSGYAVSRKGRTETKWSALKTLPSTATSFTDTNVDAGQAYEYRVLKNPLPARGGSGYLYAGIEAPLIDQRGKLILVVDAIHALPLASELDRLKEDLIGDGWEVIRIDVTRDQTPAEIRALIKAAYLLDPASTKAVFLFGHITVPYSGNINPDGHPEHKGAWPADGFYGDMDGVWTDISVNTSSAARTANWNTPGDGKFDQSEFPKELKLQVGRVDLVNMPAFAPKTELDLLRQYLNKDHNFRHGLLPLPRRGFISDNFGELYGEAFASSGFRNFAPMFGQEGITSDLGWTFFETLKDEGYLWSYACGAGAYNYAEYIGGTGGFGAANNKSVFTMLLGSYFGDWEADNCFLRGPLGTETYGLTSVWAGRPHWFFHHMALGETIGQSTLATQNSGVNGLYIPRDFSRSVHIALMGDPSLRMHPVLPPKNFKAIRSANGVNLIWSKSSDTHIVGYHVYRAATPEGPFRRITTNLVTAPAFKDTSLVENFYQARAVKLESSASGSYFNQSQGVFAQAVVGAEPGIPLALSVKNATTLALRFPSEPGVSYTVSYSENFSGWLGLKTIQAKTAETEVTDKFNPERPVRFYRVIANK